MVPFDGEDYTPIEYLKYDLTSLGHILRGRRETLIIGSGGGRDVLTGLIFGAERVDAVGINPLIFDAMNGPLANFSGHLYQMEKVRPIFAEGRSFARKHPKSYDLIQVAMIDTWASTMAGAYSLSENILYTVEAFEDYLKALKKDGILTFTRFFFTPPREALRLFTLFIDAAERLDIENPDDCILVAKYSGLDTLLFKRETFTHAEITKFRMTLVELGIELVYSPEDRPDKIFAEVMAVEDRELFYRRYPFDVSPPTDNRPFFFNMLKERDFLREGLKFNYYATFTLVIVFLISIVATIFTLILPVIVRNGGVSILKGRLRLLLYFVCIGLAYITIEVALLQKFVLLLEHPAYAASAVVAVMLISSGMGSLLWGKLTVPKERNFLWSGSRQLVLCFFFIFLSGDM